MTDIEPIHSPLDSKKYRIITLKNGLRALLISDKCARKLHPRQTPNCVDIRVEQFNRNVLHIPSLQGDTDCCTRFDAHGNCLDGHDDDWLGTKDQDKTKDCADFTAAVSLSISAGGFNDPPDLAGLAHFCEHMVFFGSKKFPKHSEFDEFLARNGGMSNAHTKGDFTAFEFKVHEDSFEEGLERFANFFISPLMPIEQIMKEREIVDSEFQKKINNDHIRRNVIILSSGKRGHPVTFFISGNKTTLTKPHASESEIQKYLHQKVTEFQKKYYRPDLMTLSVQAPKSLRCLQNLVENSFGQIPSCSYKLAEPKPEPFPFDTIEFRRLYKIYPQSDRNWLIINWELPAEATRYYQAKPLEYIARVLNNEDNGGLLHYLKRENLITCINARVGDAIHETSGFSSFFTIGFNLTYSGVRNYQRILEAVFSYLKFITCRGIHRWYFTELQEIKALNFHFEESVAALDYVKLIVKSLAKFPPEDVLIANEVITKWDPEAIKKYLCMLVPARANYILMSKEFEDDCTKIEPIYQTKYNVEDLPAEFLKKLQDIAISPKFELFKPNDFLPKSFCRIMPTEEDPIGKEVDIFGNNRLEIWHRMKYSFGDKSKCEFAFITPIPALSGQHVVMTEMWIYCLCSKLSRSIRAAREAGLSCSITREFNGFEINVVGFTEKLGSFIKIILSQMKSLSGQITLDMFNTIKGHFIDDYYNGCIDIIRFQNDIMNGVFQAKYWLFYDLRIQLKCLTFPQFKKFCQEFLTRLYCRATIIANLTAKTAIELGLSALEILNYRPLLPHTMPELRLNQLPIGETILCVKNMQPKGDVTQITKYFQLGIVTDKIDLFGKFIESFMLQCAFDQLRTKEGLGYSVLVEYRIVAGILSLVSLILSTSSEKFSASFINERMNIFILNFYEKFVKNLTLKEFETNIKKIAEIEDAALSLEMHEVKFLFEMYFLPQGKMRQISVQVVGHQDKEYTAEHKHCGKCPNNGRPQKNLHTKYNSFISKPDMRTDFPLVVLAPTAAEDAIFEVDPYVRSINDFKDSLAQFPVQLGFM